VPKHDVRRQFECSLKSFNHDAAEAMGPATVQTLSPKDQELGRAGQWGKRGISGMGTERAGTWIVELHWLPLTLRLALVGCEVHVDCGRVFGDEAVRRPAVPLL
jgi:hypothetical protein